MSHTRRMCVHVLLLLVCLGILSIAAERRPCAFFISFRRIPPLDQELGCSPTLSRILRRDNKNYYFDPLQLATDDNFARLREAELKHGRVAMLATVGMVLPSVLANVINPVSFLPTLVIPKTALRTLQSMSLAQYAQIVVTCAILEGFVFFQQNPLDMPGDYGTGYFGVRDKGLHERSLVSELENGRLAMLAFVFQIGSEVVTGKGVVEQWQTYLSTKGIS